MVVRALVGDAVRDHDAVDSIELGQSGQNGRSVRDVLRRDDNVSITVERVVLVDDSKRRTDDSRTKVEVILCRALLLVGDRACAGDAVHRRRQAVYFGHIRDGHECPEREIKPVDPDCRFSVEESIGLCHEDEEGLGDGSGGRDGDLKCGSAGERTATGG